jgi:uncharacterized integral membrane protein
MAESSPEPEHAPVHADVVHDGAPDTSLAHQNENATQGVSRASAAWVATGAALVLLVLLIVFILQNQEHVEVKFLGFDSTVPLGVAMLISAVAGGGLVGVAGLARVIQLRRAVKDRT